MTLSRANMPSPMRNVFFLFVTTASSSEFLGSNSLLHVPKRLGRGRAQPFNSGIYLPRRIWIAICWQCSYCPGVKHEVRSRLGIAKESSGSVEHRQHFATGRRARLLRQLLDFP